MSEKRSKNQEQLALPFVCGSEASGVEGEGTEALMARGETENPAGNPWLRVDSITNRTAVYGPVRTVVWEGRRSDPSPYPDQGDTRLFRGYFEAGAFQDA